MSHGIKLVNIKHKPTPEYDIYIGRANGWLGLPESKWHNPFPMKNESERPGVIENYEKHVRARADLIASLHELKGKTLGCYCMPKTCHGSVLIKLYEEFIEK